MSGSLRCDHVRRVARKWVREGGGVLAADSPKAMFKLIKTLKDKQILRVIGDYLGEPPVLSVKKTTLRRVAPDSKGGWHQDGAFLGQGIRTLNLWVALSDCGVDAPSMDMIPARLDRILPTGQGGADFGWSVGDEFVTAGGVGFAPVRLRFSAGDVIFFDEMNLHRTAVDESMTRTRYAIEAWFFAPSSYPLGQIPIVC
jgi:ectoine hydroxylase-related dioxygenase (phytanoyl-CoA dioxygenase family)